MKKRFSNLQQKLRDGNHMTSINLDEAEKHVCLNCGTEYRGDFCPRCKQKATTKRLTLKDTLRNFSDRFTHVDRGLLHTVIDLLIRPGYMVRDYLRGHRAEYIDPLMLTIIIVAVSYFIPDMPDEGEPIAPYPATWDALLANYPIVSKLTHFFYWIITDDQRFLILTGLIFTPAIPITLRLIGAKEKSLNLSESLHLLLYSFSYSMIFMLCLEAIILLLPASMTPKFDYLIAIWIIMLITVTCIMVKACTEISWKKMVFFIILAPIVAKILMNGFYYLYDLLINILLPSELESQISINAFFAK